MTTKRYTPDELRGAASFSPGNKTIAAMLKQAADDCEDAERYRWLRDKSSFGLVWATNDGQDWSDYWDYFIDRALTQEQAK